MKIALKISFIFNLGLLACLIFTWTYREREETTMVRHPAAPITTPTNSAPAMVVITAGAPSAPGFNWKQLEAGDYQNYVKNLRAIGCPETALRAIVTADVDIVYQDRSRRLEKQLADIENASWSDRLKQAGASETVKTELLKLPQQEIVEIDDLLGVKPPPGQDTMASTSEDDANSAATDPVPVAMPLVFQAVDPVALGLNDDQKQAIETVRQNFIAKIGGTNQDPNDPAYLARWQQNLPAADSQLRMTMGNEIYAKYLAAQNSAAKPDGQ